MIKMITVVLAMMMPVLLTVGKTRKTSYSVVEPVRPAMQRQGEPGRARTLAVTTQAPHKQSSKVPYLLLLFT